MDLQRLALSIRRVAAASALSAALAVAAACGSSSDSASSSPSTEATSASPTIEVESSSPTPSPTLSPTPARPPTYCEDLADFAADLEAFRQRLQDGDSGDFEVRVDLAEQAGSLAGDASILSNGPPVDVAAALLTLGNEVLDAGDRILDGDSLDAAAAELDDETAVGAQDTVNRHLEEGACA
ncbi:MAG TPA: hypothetical protein VHG10_00605 [Glycomyces sp.]|nr:hypothetical protein [Glycomyces sp.]